MEGLGRRVPERTKYGIHAGLIACTLPFEPLKHVLIQSQRHKRLGRNRLQASPHDATNNVLHIKLGMFLGGNTFGLSGTQASPISLGFERSRGLLHASWLCGRR
jgi:hypothetical protein